MLTFFSVFILVVVEEISPIEGIMRYRLPHRVVIQRGLLHTLTIIEMCRQVLNTNPSSVELYIYLGKIVTEIFKLIKPACLCHVCKLQLK